MGSARSLASTRSACPNGHSCPVMAASASYIAAPAAVRIALPEANPGYYLTAALAITFPFNLTVGIPVYCAVAQWMHAGGTG